MKVGRRLQEIYWLLPPAPRPYSSDSGVAIDGSEEDTFLIDALVLNAEEHRGDELQHECLEACHLDILLIRDLVDTIEHIALGGQLQER